MNSLKVIAIILILVILSCCAMLYPRPRTPLQFAEGELGVSSWDETSRANPDIVKYIHPFVNNKSQEELIEIANNRSCGYFLAWCLKQAGYRYPEDPESINDW